MTTCISCGKTRGPMGWLSWHKCSACDGNYCPSCFGELSESSAEREYKHLPREPGLKVKPRSRAGLQCFNLVGVRVEAPRR